MTQEQQGTTDRYTFLRNWSLTPLLSQHFSLTEKLSVNVGLGEGYVGSFPETYNDPEQL